MRASREKGERLTRHHSGGAVLLGVAVLPTEGAGVGFCLVGAQSLPLLLQAVFVLHVILHVGLEEKRGSYYRSICLCAGDRSVWE